MDFLGSAVTANLPVWMLEEKWRDAWSMLSSSIVLLWWQNSLTNQWTGCSLLFRSFWTLRNLICRDYIQSQCFVSQHIVINYMPRQGPRLCLISQYMYVWEGTLVLSEVIAMNELTVIKVIYSFFCQSRHLPVFWSPDLGTWLEYNLPASQCAQYRVWRLDPKNLSRIFWFLDFLFIQARQKHLRRNFWSNLAFYYRNCKQWI